MPAAVGDFLLQRSLCALKLTNALLEFTNAGCYACPLLQRKVIYVEVSRRSRRCGEIDGIVHADASRVVVLNTGISTIAPLEQLLEVRETRPPMKLINCYAGLRFARAVHEIEEQAFGGHADEVETALMLAIDPSRVALDRARPADIHVKRGMFNRTDPDAPNYSPTGVNGDPTRATIEKGERLLAALIEDLMAEVSEFAQ